VGERQQRLLRELEKLALELGPGTRIGVAEIEAAAAVSAERKVWALGDALVAGKREDTLRILLELRAQGERLPGMIFRMAGRLREALAVAEQLAAGRPASDVKRSLRMPPKAAEKFVADVGRRDVEAFRRALVRVADLELESRGGTELPLSEDTAAVRAVIASSV
jgi:DNA polymerase-3 subunit delta